MPSFLPRPSLLVSATVLAAGALLGNRAFAGPPEVLSGLVQAPNNAQLLVLAYDNALGGLVLSRDGGATFQIYPGTAITRDGTKGFPPLLLTGDGKLLMGLLDGLAYDDGTGCGIQYDATLLKQWVTAIERHPADANVAFVLTTGGANGARTGLWKRDANGAITGLSGNDTGTQMGTPDYNKPVFVSYSLRVIARAQSTQGLRFVESGFKVANSAEQGKATRTPTFRYSDDLGATWTEHTIPSVAAADQPALVAVTGDEPMKVVLAVRKTASVDPPDLVLLSTDGGQNFATYIEGIISVGQSVQTPDGHFYIADNGLTSCSAPTGLWVAPQLGAKAERITSEAVTCLGYDAPHDALYFCKRGYELGRFFPNTHSYCRMFKMSDVTDFACPAIVPDLHADGGPGPVDEQLCGAWCGGAHYSFSPFCEKTSCVAIGRGYDTDAGWIAGPGDEQPSCNGFAGGNMLGTDLPAFCGADGDGGVGGPASDAGAQPNADAAVNHTEAGAGEPDMGSDGCDCSAAHRGSRPPDLAGFALGLWLLVRGRRRRARA